MDTVPNSEQKPLSVQGAESPPKPRRMDGRALRSERTKQLIIEAYLTLLDESPETPTAAQIARRAGYSVRSVFERFDDMLALTVAAADYAFAEGLSRDVHRHLGETRGKRLRGRVERRSELIERFLPLWRVLQSHQHESELVRARIGRVRDTMWTRLALIYRVELASLPEFESKRLQIALEQLTDFESWARMRERHGLSVEEARDVWMMAIERLLPPRPPQETEPAPV